MRPVLECVQLNGNEQLCFQVSACERVWGKLHRYKAAVLASGGHTGANHTSC